MSNSAIIMGKCNGCGNNVGLAYVSKLNWIVLDALEEFIKDEDLRMYCPVCKEFKRINNMKLKKYEVNEVKRKIEMGKTQELIK